MPEGTIFSKFEFCVFGDLEIKGETLGNDYVFQSIVDAVKCERSEEFSSILFRAVKTGASFELDFDCTNRDGCFDADQLFAVWDLEDVIKLIARIQLALEYSIGRISRSPN